MTVSVQLHATVASVKVRASWQAALAHSRSGFLRKRKQTHIPSPKTNVDSSDAQLKGQLPKILSSYNKTHEIH
jgi:hypothetical protein